MKKEISLSSPWLWFSFGVGVILIPVVLNWVLQWTVPACTEVIGGARSTEVWLVFWGSFLAAIASGIMAWITYRTARMEREREIKRYDLDMLRSEYDNFEREIQLCEEIHSVSYFMKLWRQSKIDSTNDLQLLDDALREQLVALKKVSSLAVKYNWSDESIQNYCVALKDINSFCINLNTSLREKIAKKHSLDEIMHYLNGFDKPWNDLYDILFNSGFDLLSELHHTVKKKYEELQDLRL